MLHRIQLLARRYGRVEAGGALRIEHGLSHEKLGQSISASRVGVTQLLNAWRAERFLDFGRGVIVIHDLARWEASLRD